MRNAMKLLTVLGGGSGVAYLLNDQFITDRAAGAVNGTQAEPTGGIRTVVDVATTKVVITSGKLRLTGTGTFEQEKIDYGVALVRAAGAVMRCDYNNVDGVLSFFGLRRDFADTFTDHDNHGFFIEANHTWRARRIDTASSVILMTGVANTEYRTWTVLRNTGRYLFIKGVDSIIRLHHLDEWSSQTPLYFSAQAHTNNRVMALDNVAIIENRFYAVMALASDSFNRANGAIGNSDGAGHAEATSGGGNAWTNQVGAYTVASNVASSSTLSGGVAIATIDAGTPHVYLRVKVTHGGGNAGVVLRYVDSSNYIYAYHDGTNVTLRKVVGGNDGEVIAPVAATYSAGAYLTVVADGESFELFYNEVRRGTGTISDAAVASATAHGLYSTNTGNTFDDFVVFARRGYTDLEQY